MPQMRALLVGFAAVLVQTVAAAGPPDYAAWFAHPEARIMVSAGNFAMSLRPRENSTVPTDDPNRPAFHGVVSGGNAAPRVVWVEWWFVERREAGDLYVFTTLEPDGTTRAAAALYRGAEAVAYDADGLRIRVAPSESAGLPHATAPPTPGADAKQ